MSRSPAKSNAGFTLLELLVAMGLIGLLVGFTGLKLGKLNQQLKSSAQTRHVGMTIGTLRAEAIRLRTNVRVTFASSGLTWDINDDGTTDGSLPHKTATSWGSGTPASVVFNPFGLVRSATTDQTVTSRCGTSTSTVVINKNGYLKF